MTGKIGVVSTIPVRGRKRPGLLVAEGFIGTIPVRGRKLAIAAEDFLFSEYHPRKGAKTKSAKNRNKKHPYHPRKGSKTSLPCHQSPCTRFQLLPARGRKLDAHVVGVRSIDFNLSPQGDGNVICCRSSPCNADFDLSP